MVNLKNIKLFLLDLDGTLYIDNEVIPGAPQTVERLRSLGAEVCFLTNNSSRSTEEYLQKLNALGFEAAEEEFYSSTLATIEYLRNTGHDDNVYLLAPESVRAEFRSRNIRLYDFSENEKLFQHARLLGKNATVVVGFDTNLNYDSLKTACRLLQNEAHFVATHPDLVCPAAGGPVPDTGSFLRLIETACEGRTPDIICGKPFLHMAECLMDRYNLMPVEIGMIGDRLSTDIRFAADNGFSSILVLSGEADRAALAGANMAVDLVLDDIGELNNFLNLLR